MTITLLLTVSFLRSMAQNKVQSFIGISTPEISVQLEDHLSNVFTQKSSTVSALGGQLVIGFRYAFTDQLALSLRGDCFRKAEIRITNENRNNNSGRLVTKQEMT